jgi:hypothetical protein
MGRCTAKKNFSVLAANKDVKNSGNDVDFRFANGDARTRSKRFSIIPDAAKKKKMVWQISLHETDPRSERASGRYDGVGNDST